MSWFKVDDGLHAHRKARKVRKSHASKARDVAPFGLWVLAGSWAGANSSTKGFVPTEVLEEWDDDATELAERLVAAGLWWETSQDGEGGYGFHDWQDYVPRPEGITDAADSGRRGNHVRWHEKRGMVDADCEFCVPDRGDIGATIGATRVPDSGANRVPVPSRPDPTNTCAPSDPPGSASADAEREFETWYLAYPRKRGKGQAAKAYRGARKKTDAATLLEAVRRQTPTLTAKGPDFVPYPATWLNGERWADEPDNVRHLPQIDDQGRTILPPLPPKTPWGGSHQMPVDDQGRTLLPPLPAKTPWGDR